MNGHNELQTCKLSGELSSMIQTDNQLSEPEACESTIKAPAIFQSLSSSWGEERYTSI
jgi:hypothetical protein